MDLFDAICGRRAVRHYRQDCPPEHVLRQLVKAATWAPSAMDDQSWHFTVITRQELLDRIAVRAQLWVRENEPWLADNQEMRRLLADPDFHMLHHAPVLIVISAPAEGKWSAESCSAAAQNLGLAATAHGLGSCWIGLAQDWLNSPEGRDAIILPEGERVIAPLVVGYASAEPHLSSRRKPNVTWIGETNVFVEAGEPALPGALPGLFGNPVVPG
jgi:nitroreductase